MQVYEKGIIQKAVSIWYVKSFDFLLIIKNSIKS